MNYHVPLHGAPHPAQLSAPSFWYGIEEVLVLVHCGSFAPVTNARASLASPIQAATASHDERHAALWLLIKLHAHVENGELFIHADHCVSHAVIELSNDGVHAGLAAHLAQGAGRLIRLMASRTMIRYASISTSPLPHPSLIPGNACPNLGARRHIMWMNVSMYACACA